MSEELSKLESALRATSPKAAASVRRRAIAQAMEAFDRHHQETSDEPRHKKQVPNCGTSWIRRLAMLLPRPSFALAGSVAVVAVVGIASHQVLIAPPAPPTPRVEPVGIDASSLAHEGAPDETAEFSEAELADARQAMESRFDAASAEAAASAPSQGESGGLLISSGIASATRAMKNSMQMPEPAHHLPQYPEAGQDRFAEFSPNPVKVVVEEPVSTFSIDVDTASYAFLRASLNEGYLPEKHAVRTEELINYFPYDYAPPETRDTPFATHVAVIPAPWNDDARLLHIGIKGYELDRSAAVPVNLVFLIDTSGSMDEPNKLPLLIRSLELLLGALAPQDRVAIVTYAGTADVVLEPTPVAERAAIRASLERLRAGGSTAGSQGIREAYRLAEQHRVEGGVNRIILATDGDFNVGIADPQVLEDFIARKRSSGVSLSVLGFGRGNYNDAIMQRLAQHGNGNAAYIDTLSEARKVLLEEAASTLVTIARDVKVQVEFNPAAVREYRLIGYETRMLAREAFRNDKVDAGDIGAGHTVTALYELTPAGSEAGRIPALRYQDEGAQPATDFADEIAFVKIRYKLPDVQSSTLIERPVTAADALERMDDVSPDARFAVAVAGFGELLGRGRYSSDYDYDDVIALAQGARGEDPFGYRNEFVRLVRLAQSLTDLEY